MNHLYPNRFIRVLVYQGSEEWLRVCRNTRAIQGTFLCSAGSIHEVLATAIKPGSPEETISTPFGDITLKGLRKETP